MYNDKLRHTPVEVLKYQIYKFILSNLEGFN